VEITVDDEVLVGEFLLLRFSIRALADRRSPSHFLPPDDHQLTFVFLLKAKSKCCLVGRTSRGNAPPVTVRRQQTLK